MMYQRCAMLLAPQPKKSPDAHRQDLINQQEENRADRNHDKDHDGRNARFLARRPGYFRRFLADLANELAWTCFSHRTCHLK